MYEIRGAEHLAALAKRLRQVGDKDLQRQFYAALNRATKPVKKDLRRSQLSTFPKRGGLARREAKKTRYRTVRRTTGAQRGLRITASGGQLTGMDKGELRHKTFGRLPWQTQRITPGWFTRPTQAAGPAVRREVEQAMHDITQELNRR